MNPEDKEPTYRHLDEDRADSIRDKQWNEDDKKEKTISSITFRVWQNGGNYAEVDAFVGPQPECPVCGGSGEYEDEYGLHSCMPCNSRLFPFIDYRGKLVYADDGDTIRKEADGLHLN